MRIFIIVILLLTLGACVGVKNAPKYELDNGYYDFHQDGEWRKNVYVTVQNDTLKVFGKDALAQPVIPDASKEQIFLKRSFDLDVMTIAFKYRPVESCLPTA